MSEYDQSLPHPGRALWREPAASLPLRWGGYRSRLVAGIAMLLLGTGAILATTAYSLPLLLAGSLLQPAGWAVLPSTIGRRVTVTLPALGFSWLMLGGSAFAWCYAVPLAAWLLVRFRPPASFAVLLAPIASALAFAPLITDYEQGWLIVLVQTAVVIGSAWLARSIARTLDSWQSARTRRKQPDRLV